MSASVHGAAEPPLMSTFPVRIFFWTLLGMAILFALSWYLDAYLCSAASGRTCRSAHSSTRGKSPCDIAVPSVYPYPDMMERSPGNIVRWLFDSRHGAPERLIPRWIFLRALGLIYFSAFYALLFQIKGLIGPQGILPAQHFLAVVARSLGVSRYWYAPSLFWFSAGSHALMAVTWIGLIASVAAFLNLWPRLSFFICFVCFLSFVSTAQIFSGYQSDGMLLGAGFLALFFAPRGLMPGWGASSPPSRASLFLLQWEWFRIYFESGMVKLLSGDPEWRHFTAMDQYYQNGPLPTWIGWYVQHLPHWFQAATVGATLVMELGLVFMLFFPRRVRAHLLLHRHAMGDRRNSHRQLRLPQLPGALARLSAARRPHPSALCSCALAPAESRS